MNLTETVKPLLKQGEHFLPIFCLNCYQHSWKNCYGENPCTPVRLLYREFPLDPEARKAALLLQELNSKVSFEKKETWNKKIKRA